MSNIETPSSIKKGILEVKRSGIPFLLQKEPTKTAIKVYVILHSYTSLPTHWKEYIAFFERDYHVVQIAFPFKTHPSYSAMELAVLSVLEDYRSSAGSAVYIHGIDWGAFVALKMVNAYPGIISKLVVQNRGIIGPIHQDSSVGASPPTFEGIHVWVRWWYHLGYILLYGLSLVLPGSLMRCFHNPAILLYPYWTFLRTSPPVYNSEMPQCFLHHVNASIPYHGHDYLIQLTTKNSYSRCKGFPSPVENQPPKELAQLIRGFLAQRIQ